MSRFPVMVSALPLSSPRVDPRFAISPRGIANVPMPSPRPTFPVASARSMQGSGSASVEIVQRRGNVVTYGPAGNTNRSGDRLPRIICYGDSNTAGFCNGGSQYEPYGRTLAARLAEQGIPCEVSVCGLCSLTTEDMLNGSSLDTLRTPIGPHGRGLERMLDEDGDVDLVVIMSGTNDIGTFTPVPQVIEDLEKLHALCHDRGIPTVAIAATQVPRPEWRPVRQELADKLQQWARSTQNVIDFHDVEDLLPRQVTKSGAPGNPSAAVHWESDELHISAAGSVQLGRRLAPYASNWLKKLQAGVIERPVARPKASTLQFKQRLSPLVSSKSIAQSGYISALSLKSHMDGGAPLVLPASNHAERSPRVIPALPSRSARSVSFNEGPALRRNPVKGFQRSHTFS